MILSAGTKITCPVCDAHIATVKDDIASGEILKASSFIGVSQEINNGEAMECKNCGGRYADQFKCLKIHTEDGWL